MSKFTPAPWTDNKKDHDAPYQPIGINGPFHRICTIWIDDAPVEGFNREQRANAHLIAAAPDLYEALDKLKSSYEALAHDYEYAVGAGDIHPLHAEHIQRCAAALAKARGENQ